MTLNENALITRILAEKKLTAERALEVFVQTLIAQHIEMKRRRGNKSALHIDVSAPSALQVVCDALRAAHLKNKEHYMTVAVDGFDEENDEVSDDDFVDAIIRGAIAEAQDGLFRIFATCEIMHQDEPLAEPKPAKERVAMRLVRE